MLTKLLIKRKRGLKALILETLIITPANKIKITIFKPGPLNTNFKLVIVA